ncbi:MAG: hypothetical protein JO345_15095, partial [Streptosporangiaceae bacterium]|nr:hypothetical protein [Streptosporangiaceae bacterium]
DAGRAPPRGPVETTLASLWARLLGTPAISRDDNFFTLGGDSLLATKLIAAIQRELSAPVSLRHLLGAPTLAELAALVEIRSPAGDPELVDEGVV